MARPRTGIEPRIVKAARARFLAEGVDGASLRTIAKDAKTSVGMISYYFPTKDDLFLAVVEEVYGKLLADLEEILSGAPARAPSVRECLELAFTRLGQASEHEMEVVRLVAREALLSSTRLERIVARAQRGHLKILGATLLRGVEAHEIDPEIPLPLLVITTMAMGGVPQIIRRVLREKPPFDQIPDAAGLAALSGELLFRAIGPRPPKPSAAKTKGRGARAR